jgi:hypothetical protein
MSALQKVNTYWQDYMQEFHLCRFVTVYEGTASMHQSPPWEANRSSDNPEISLFYRIWKFITVLKCSPQLSSILPQMYPVHILPTHFFNIYFNIILSFYAKEITADYAVSYFRCQ